MIIELCDNRTLLQCYIFANPVPIPNNTPKDDLRTCFGDEGECDLLEVLLHAAAKLDEHLAHANHGSAAHLERARGIFWVAQGYNL